MEGRLACLFFFLAILYDDEVAGVNRVMFGPDKQRNSRLVIDCAIRCCLFVWSKHHSGASRLAVSVYAVSVRIYYCVTFSTPSPLLPTHPTDIEGVSLTLVTPNWPITTSSANSSHSSILHLDMHCGSQIQGIRINPYKLVMSVRRGKFHRFFNALLPADDTFHELGVGLQFVGSYR
jgi:hypothetical protein